jgi:hypothetical protein
LAGAVPQGISNACTNNVRFTATLFVEPDRAPTAISTVIFMGSSAAFFGPELSKYTRVWLPEPFAGTYILATIYWILLLIFSLAIDFPKVNPSDPCTPPSKTFSEFSTEISTTNLIKPNIIFTKPPALSREKSRNSLLIQSVFCFEKPPPRPSAAAGTAGTAAAATSGRPIKEIASSPVFMFAICMQTIAFAGMAGLMTATPVKFPSSCF